MGRRQYQAPLGSRYQQAPLMTRYPYWAPRILTEHWASLPGSGHDSGPPGISGQWASLPGTTGHFAHNAVSSSNHWAMGILKGQQQAALGTTRFQQA